ncbi:CbtA family protein [Aestuariivirga sp.]|jgi:cobalt transporter subunit CbtA|uniref:CbtA family protein n=1 Tax=Aestuariivirga sp. TaxID=2650926 RepID=UPI003784157B
MTGRVVLATLLAGIVAGLIMGAIQHVRLTPLILAAEAYETESAKTGHTHGSSANHETGHEHGSSAWVPTNGWQRSFATFLTAIMSGAAFAAVLAGISLLSGLRITRRNGLVWGMCGFLAVSLAPAIGLPPELPGVPAGDLMARQVWWAATIVATGLGLVLLASRQETWVISLALILMALPHIIGAPHPMITESSVPPALAASFAANALAANAIFWLLIGHFLALAFDRAAKDIYSQ